eukprot:1440977-Rhodomonas_salina.1
MERARGEKRRRERADDWVWSARNACLGFGVAAEIQPGSREIRAFGWELRTVMCVRSSDLHPEIKCKKPHSVD